MTNEKYTMISDIKERKAAARGARYRKCGAKSKKCTLPSDHLTAAEKKRRNGPVSTIKLNEPITYRDFKTLSPTLQALYLDHLIHEYKARRIDIVKMLGISQSMFTKLKPTIPCKLEFPDKGQKHPAPEWQRFIAGQAEEVTPDAPAPEIAEPEITEPEITEPEVSKAEVLPLNVVLIQKPPIIPDKLSLTITGTPAELQDWINIFTDPTTTYKFELNVIK